MNAGRAGAPSKKATRPNRHGQAAIKKPSAARPRRTNPIAPAATPPGDDTTGADGPSGRRSAGTDLFGWAVANHVVSTPETGVATAAGAALSLLNNVSVSSGMTPTAVGPSLSGWTLITAGVATTGAGVTGPSGEDAGLADPPDVPAAGTSPEAVSAAGLATASTIGAAASTTGCATSSTGCATSTTGSTISKQAPPHSQ